MYLLAGEINTFFPSSRSTSKKGDGEEMKSAHYKYNIDRVAWFMAITLFIYTLRQQWLISSDIIITRESHEHDKELYRISHRLNKLNVWSNFRANSMHRALFQSTKYIYDGKWRKSFGTPGAQFNHVAEAHTSFATDAYVYGSDQRLRCLFLK